VKGQRRLADAAAAQRTKRQLGTLASLSASKAPRAHKKPRSKRSINPLSGEIMLTTPSISVGSNRANTYMCLYWRVSLIIVHASTETGDQFLGDPSPVDAFNVACKCRLAWGSRGASWGASVRIAIGRQLGLLLTSLNIAPCGSPVRFSDRPTRTARSLSQTEMGVMQRTNFLGSQDVGFAHQALAFPVTLGPNRSLPYLDEARCVARCH